MKKYEQSMKVWPLVLPFMFLYLSAAAQSGEGAPSRPYKLTTGFYQFSGAGSQNGQAVDINLRHTSAIGNVWVGHYVSWAHELTQDRLGWDRSIPVGMLRIQPSAQLATGGALNGGVGIETGEDWYVGAGLGRTNLRETINLNFDPNDSYSLSGGYRWHESKSLSFLLVRDNRLNPDQQHLHLIYRTPLSDGRRLSIDVLFKRGLVEDEMVERTGLSVTHDWPRWFLRLSYDPKVNFTSQDMLRFAAGTRF